MFHGWLLRRRRQGTLANVKITPCVEREREKELHFISIKRESHTDENGSIRLKIIGNEFLGTGVTSTGTNKLDNPMVTLY